MCKVFEDMCAQVRKDAMIKIAKQMIKDGTLPLEKIAEYMSLSLDEVRSLQAGRNA